MNKQKAGSLGWRVSRPIDAQSLLHLCTDRCTCTHWKLCTMYKVSETMATKATTIPTGRIAAERNNNIVLE